MAYDMIKKLDTDLRKAHSSQRPQLLTGVYKQLVKSHKGRQVNGEYRRAVESMPEESQADFYVNFTRKLLDEGLDGHACRLMEQHLPETFVAYSGATKKMKTICMSLVEGCSDIDVVGKGVRMDYNGYSAGEDYASQITTKDGENYSIDLRLPDNNSEGDNHVFIKGVSLDDAVDLACAARTRDEDWIKDTLDRIQ